MKIVLKKSFDEIVEKDWKYIQKYSSLLIFQSYEWNYSWYKYNNFKKNLRIFLIYEEDKPIAIFPFIIERFLLFKFVKWIGYDLSDYLGPIFNKNYNFQKENFNFIWKEILELLKGESDLIILDKLIDKKNYFENPMVKFLDCKKHDITYGINLSNWENLVKEKSRALQKYRWSKKKISEFGNLVFEKNISNIEEKKRAISLIINWKKKMKKNKNIIFSNSFNESFYNEILKNKDTHLAGLKLNNEFIAISFGIKYENNYLYLVPAYYAKNEILKYSPGKILMIELIKYLSEKKINYFDFGSGAEVYKTEWKNHDIEVMNYIKQSSFFGFLLKSLYKIKKLNIL